MAPTTTAGRDAARARALEMAVTSHGATVLIPSEEPGGLPLVERPHASDVVVAAGEYARFLDSSPLSQQLETLAAAWREAGYRWDTSIEWEEIAYGQHFSAEQTAALLTAVELARWLEAENEEPF